MFKIAKISYIAKGKKSGLSHVVLHLSNGKVIVRRVKQMLTDLADSFLIPSAELPITSARVRKVLRDLQGGSVNGDVRFYKKGDEYTLNENSSLVLKGVAKAGESAKHESDGAWVEGFLSLEVCERADRNERIAEAYAELLGSLQEFATPVSATSGQADDDEDEYAFPHTPPTAEELAEEIAKDSAAEKAAAETELKGEPEM